MIEKLANPQHGGNAFPQDFTDRDGLGYMEHGMTLRDYFAIRAFQTRLAMDRGWTLTELTNQSYLDANAMLEARK